MEHVEIGRVYRHFKGNYYFVENIAYDSETMERMVVYKPLYQREDESEEAVKIRLDTYNKQTRPLIDYYTMKGSIININGDQPMEDVFKDIEKSLEGK